MNNPILQNTIEYFFFDLFLYSAIQKMLHFSPFTRSVEGYQLLPRYLVVPLSILILLFEMGAAGSFLFIPKQAGVSLALGLLISFSLAVLVNLLRGHKTIDCGCFGPSTEAYSWMILARNFILCSILVLLYLLPLAPRFPTFWERIFSFWMGTVFFIIFSGWNQIITNAAQPLLKKKMLYD
ncbi:MauE/DoxX family redox-associated membrane protein [Methylacidiphilum kamchatkense]|uniref:Methylamine utilization protein MauE n=1 Tax=Methylacidiphilum kamchatkense Kam1 TaxID=1202785 RepID=A0A516TJY7_9BACT|nr:MauE/DoxX family redox-associated membrane protein [Methylacidiphilum kamchatkense]QDQ41572.1 methylamine utilization protein MauE [Methylacidiphilum kamchatkense Kam1]